MGEANWQSNVQSCVTERGCPHPQPGPNDAQRSEPSPGSTTKHVAAGGDTRAPGLLKNSRDDKVSDIRPHRAVWSSDKLSTPLPRLQRRKSILTFFPFWRQFGF